jgi:hypothetical protein
VIGGEANMTRGFSRPFSPNGDTSLVAELPWKFAGDLLLIHFEADADALNAHLPKPLEPSKKIGQAFLWSPNLVCYPVGLDPILLNPLRTSYNVAVIGIPCRFNGVETMYSAYQWADKDWLLALSWFLGACSKLGVLEQSGTHAMLPGMEQDLAVGSRLRRTVSRNGEKIIDMSFMPERTIELQDMDFYLSSLPLTCERHIPDCAFPPTNKPLVHDLTQMVMSDTEFANILSGDARLEFFKADNENLMPMQPTKVLGGYWLPMGFTLDGIRSIYNYME